jgi:archaellum biogenesis ATPase FlaH
MIDFFKSKYITLKLTVRKLIEQMNHLTINIRKMMINMLAIINDIAEEDKWMILYRIKVI